MHICMHRKIIQGNKHNTIKGKEGREGLTLSYCMHLHIVGIC